MKTKTSLRSSRSLLGFTLVELIVVITILVILGTIAFVSLGGFSGSARDSSRVSDLSLIGKGLDIHYTKLWSFPIPTSSTGITFGSSSSVVWYQGTIGEWVIRSLGWAWARISTKPVDPLSKEEYRYSLPTGVNEYLLAADYEGDSVAWRENWELRAENWESGTPTSFWIPHLTSPKLGEELSFSSPILGGVGGGILGLNPEDSASASTGSPTISYLKGTYNGVATRVSSGSTINIIALPSIFLSSGSTGTIVDASSRNFLLQGKSLSWVSFAPKVVYSSGALPSNDTERLLFSSGIVAAYSGTSLATNSDIKSFIDNVNSTGSLSAIGGNFVRNKFGGNGPSIVATASSASSSSYSVGNSLMFNGSNQFLSRTGAVNGNRQKWTWSGWVKRGKLGTDQAIFGTEWSNLTQVYFNTNDKLRWYDTSGLDLVTSAVFRDPSAWYHIILSLDTTQPPWAKIFVNWQLITSFSTASYPTTGTLLYVNSTDPMGIGRVRYAGGGWYFWYADSYFSNIDFVDSWALDASYFWITNANGQWVPQSYTGDYGTNGFHLDFSSGATTTTLGKDSAPLTGTHLVARDWTLNGYVDTSSQTIDTPTNNFATWNTLPVASSTWFTYSNGNLTALSKALGTTVNPATTAYYFGGAKIYTEIKYDSLDHQGTSAGLWTYDNSSNTGVRYRSNGEITYYNGSSYVNTITGNPIATGDVVWVAVDAIGGGVSLYHNGSLQGTISAPSFTGSSRIYFQPMLYGSSQYPQSTINLGQGWASGLSYDSNAWGWYKYTPTSRGLSWYKALSSINLPLTDTIVAGSFVGNTNTDGPFIFTNGTPTSLTINGNPVIFGTHADKTAGGFKLKTVLGTYNSTGTNTWTGIVTMPFKYANAQGNP